ncbi:glutaminyl-peptide cyclotransferase [Mycobacterium sp. MS1601]|uniref:glutaminyl-peptide cyclotransferase n=1 Tax=Mycobacterium sp. MS1601 TaxID=1936029 RepID=UPI0009792F33|nr:glutaminyl-peptide cyclotransferase [Mycobacterium sp. MS1601]AQA03363.1 glutaminyl-peptide cyclotransferase [Mycobacterium sp. MS1601]
MASRFAGLAAGVLIVTATLTAPSASAEPIPVVTPVVLVEIPHDPNAYTEAFEVEGNTLYEASGLAGRSDLREVDPNTGVVRRSVPLPDDYFAEGITIVDDTIWQLTYQDGVAIIWDKATLTPLREIPVTGEGWGLCRDGDRFIMSDGSGRLQFRKLGSFEQTGAVNVTRDGVPVTGLNELECVNGQVWASLWPTDEVARIDPATGAINLIVDVSSLWKFGQRSVAQVFSGIAHLDGEEFLLTGKNWPAMYRVSIPGA